MRADNDARLVVYLFSPFYHLFPQTAQPNSVFRFLDMASPFCQTVSFCACVGERQRKVGSNAGLGCTLFMNRRPDCARGRIYFFQPYVQTVHDKRLSPGLDNLSGINQTLAYLYQIATLYAPKVPKIHRQAL